MIGARSCYDWTTASIPVNFKTENIQESRMHKSEDGVQKKQEKVVSLLLDKNVKL